MSDDNNPFDAALRSQAKRMSAPAHLRERIHAGIEAQLRADAAPAPRARALSIPLPWFNFRAFGGIATGFAMGALCAVFSFTVYLNAGSDERLDEEMVGGHVRSLLTGHVSDVISTDRHTVKPWFAGKLDFSPPVWNARPDEFPLQGGRVDYIDHHTVAALVYKRKDHFITVFVWPAGGRNVSGAGAARNGFTTLRWAEGGMQFWAVSDVSAEELQHFRKLSAVPVDDKSGS